MTYFLSYVHACENLTRLVSEIKQFLILGDFCWLEQVTRSGTEDRASRKRDLELVAFRLRDELAYDANALADELAFTEARRGRGPIAPK
ncbi:unnamed protein product [Protopolystoma xenopodis]|uniref:Uncharacterized protein n=1 Tax=Protopolystoma xenopodis TaxID=117903 RepID=A0A448WSC8_9PLAT|nr:unnamed protein product [Protopolystoma xenopodis]